MTEDVEGYAILEIVRVDTEVRKIITQIYVSAFRVKELGKWPKWVEERSLVERVPRLDDTNAPGFDAGIACALDLIPREKQKLAAILHAAYTLEAVEQIRKEMKDLDFDSETCWWLTACSVCSEGGISQNQFLQQIENFKELASDPQKRKEIAQKEFNNMTSSFYFIPELGNNVPYGTKDGCMQGAYVAGHSFAVNYSEKYGLYFLGTYHLSLGLENFAWSDEKDEKGRLKSGPVFGSKQFVKCANMGELKRALKIVEPLFVEEKKN